MQPSQILSRSTSKQEGWKPNVSPTSSQQLLVFGLECQYFGCYLSDPDDGEYRYTFPTATCTFPAQSSVQLLPTTTSAFPLSSMQPVKPMTYNPQILSSVLLDYPSKTNANSTGKSPGNSMRESKQ